MCVGTISKIGITMGWKHNIEEGVFSCKFYLVRCISGDSWFSYSISFTDQADLPIKDHKFTTEECWLLHLHTLHERDNVDSTQLQQINELIVPTFTNSVLIKSLPSSELRTEKESFATSFSKGLRKADGIAVNSFEELESYAVHAFLNDRVI